MSIIIVSRNINSKIKSDFLLLFNISFLTYIVLSILAFLSFAEINDFFIFSDQEEFFEIGQELGRLSSFFEIFHLCFVERVHLINEGVIFYFGSLAHFANIFDGNSLFYQIINIAFFGVLINIFVYRILLFYTNVNNAFKFAVYFALFSHIPAFSVWILRDIHIAFFFSVAIYFLHFSFKIRNLFILLLLSIIVFEFRIVSGLAFLFFPLFYVFRGILNSKSKIIYLIITCSALILLISKFNQQIYYSFLTMIEGFEHYSEYSVEVANDQGGLGGLLLNLPDGIKHFAVLIYSQISPFPIWDQLIKANTFIQYIFGLFFMISPLFWGFVFYFTVVNLLSKRDKLKALQRGFLFFFIIFLLGNSSNLNLRRVIAAYPILYSLFVFFITQSTKNSIRIHILTYSLVYILLINIYIFLKFLIF